MASSVDALKMDPLFPVYQRIVDIVCNDVQRSPLSNYVKVRSTLRLLSPVMRLAVDLHALFWNRFAFSPRTPPALLQIVRLRSHNLPLDITIRISASSGIPDETDSEWESVVELFMSRATIVLYTMLRGCRELTVEAASLVTLELMLQFLTPIPTQCLRAFELVYPDPFAVGVIPPFISDFIFDGRDSPAFPPFSTFTISAVRLPITLASHMSSDTCSAAVRQPINLALSWERFGTLLGASALLDTLVLHGIEFEDVPSYVVGSIPLPNLTTLDVRFSGRRSMGSALMRLNLPRFHTLVFRCDTLGDVSCFSSSLAVFAVRTRTFRFITSKRCFVSGRFRHIFSLLHRATVVDLRAASYAAFKSFLSASSATYPSAATRWRSCPALTHLLVPYIPMPKLIELVHRRRTAAHQELHILTAYLNPLLVDVGHREWFFTHAPGITLNLSDI
ncbi:hypothetical protein C8R47DRAFT_1226695 [Mycena vitilis]|nr:hypothetical protein C8R47DRAFT_1226695 [Mycena vitilis]